MRLLKIFGLLALAGWASCSPAEEPVPVQEASAAVEVFLPLGDPASGRQAFLDLECHACHFVDESMPRPVLNRPGPDFGPYLANRTRDQLARSIITPSEHNTERNQEFLDGAVSRMGDYNNVMTVRQLMDLIAFLQSIE
jgi:hypothetical protein